MQRESNRQQQRVSRHNKGNCLRFTKAVYLLKKFTRLSITLWPQQQQCCSLEQKHGSSNGTTFFSSISRYFCRHVRPSCLCEVQTPPLPPPNVIFSHFDNEKFELFPIFGFFCCCWMWSELKWVENKSWKFARVHLLFNRLNSLATVVWTGRMMNENRHFFLLLSTLKLGKLQIVHWSNSRRFWVLDQLKIKLKTFRLFYFFIFCAPPWPRGRKINTCKFVLGTLIIWPI